MDEIALEKSIKFFGASLDALDHREAVDVKRSYLHALALGKCPKPDLRDPYALFRHVVGDHLIESGHQNVGRFAIESWLTPKPEMPDMDWIDQRSYQQFLRDDGFKFFAELNQRLCQGSYLPFYSGYDRRGSLFNGRSAHGSFRAHGM